MRPAFIIPILVALVGAVFLLQGINILGGSQMSGSSFWALVGAVLVVVGVVFASRAYRARSMRG